MTDPLTTIAVDAAPYLAVDIQPDLTGPGTFMLDVSQLDAFDQLAYDAGHGEWLNIVCDVREAQLRRGTTRVQGLRTRAEAGTCTITVSDTLRRLDPLLNRDAVHKGIPFRLRAWGYAPELTRVELRRNLAANPSLELTATGWSAVGAGSVARSTVRGWAGTASALVTFGAGAALTQGTQVTVAGLTIGATYTASAYLYVPTASLSAAPAIRVAGISSGTVVGTGNTWVRSVATFTATATSHVVQMLNTATVAAGATMHVDALLVERAATAGVYFDGSTPDTGEADGDLTHGWYGGAPHTVPSIEYVWQTLDTLWTEPLFTGQLDEVLASYPPDEPPLVTLSTLDLIGPLTAWRSAGLLDPGVGASENLLDRVYRLTNLLERTQTGGWVDGGSDPEYLATLMPTKEQQLWDEIAAAQDAELGRVWVTNENRLMVRSRFSELTGTIHGTLSDQHGEASVGVHCCYTDPGVVLGVEMLTNYAVAGRVGAPELVELVDDYSRTRYGRHAVEERGLILGSAGELTAWAQALIVEGSDPELRVDQVTPVPSDAAAWRAVVSTDIGDRWLFLYRPAIGPAVDRALGVLGIEHTITPDGWTVLFRTDDAPKPDALNPTGWFALDVSELDGGDVLAAFGGMPVGST